MVETWQTTPWGQPMKMEMLALETEADPVGLSIKVEPGGRWCHTEPKVQAGQHLTKAEPVG